jgi:hypothetical protein
VTTKTIALRTPAIDKLDVKTWKLTVMIMMPVLMTLVNLIPEVNILLLSVTIRMPALITYAIHQRVVNILKSHVTIITNVPKILVILITVAVLEV